MKVVIDGAEYIPRAEVPPLPDDQRLIRLLRELVNIQYFSSETHKHRAWAWDALNAVAPELAELAGDNPKAAYDRLNPDSV